MRKHPEELRAARLRRARDIAGSRVIAWIARLLAAGLIGEDFYALCGLFT